MQNEIFVYVDVIFLENLIIDYVLIDVCGRISGFPAKPLRILAGAALGSVYAVVICVFTYLAENTAVSLLMKFVVSVLMCGISFGFCERKRLFLCNILLYSVSFLAAGIFLVMGVSGEPVSVGSGGVVVSWGKSSFMRIIFMIGALYVLAVLFSGFLRKKSVKRAVLALVIETEGKQLAVNALCDTGNELRDKLRGLPVIVCELKCLGKLFDEATLAEAEKLRSRDNENSVLGMMNLFEAKGLKNRISVISCNTVSNDLYMMVGLVVDRVYVSDKPSDAVRAVVCFVDKKLSDVGEYNALVSPDIFLTEEN